MKIIHHFSSLIYHNIKRKLSNVKGKTWKLLGGAFLFLTVLTFSLFFRIYKIENKISLGIISPKDSVLVIESQKLLKGQKNTKFEKIGWITDIHADRFKRRTIDSGTIYPRKYEDYLPKALDAMREQGIDMVIATGDNTNSGDDNYARELSKIAQEKNMNMIWVRGNHDNDKVMSILAPGKNKYYYEDYGNTRIVALDDVEANGDYQGYIDPEQLNWLKEILKTDKQVVISMHIPIFDGGDELMNNYLLKGDDFVKMGDLLERYSDFEKVLRENNNVIAVISGHWHVPWRKQYNGINYYGQAALTREGYTGAYGVLDLKNKEMKYLFAN